MSMEHKAYLFDYYLFEKELSTILYEALSSQSIDKLDIFIHNNLSSIKTPWEGEDLKEDNMHELEELKDVHNYGDFALTKYYDSLKDEGLDIAWQDLPEEINHLFLGKPFGPEGNHFDPGKYGSYFIKPDDVDTYFNKIKRIKDSQLAESIEDLEDYDDQIDQYLELLRSAKNNQKGIYITF